MAAELPSGEEVLRFKGAPKVLEREAPGALEGVTPSTLTARDIQDVLATAQARAAQEPHLGMGL